MNGKWVVLTDGILMYFVEPIFLGPFIGWERRKTTGHKKTIEES